MTRTSMELHAEAMLDPRSPQERRLVTLFRVLDEVGEVMGNDNEAQDAIEHLGSAIIRLMNFGTDRIEASHLDLKVREIVQKAGVDASNL